MTSFESITWYENHVTFCFGGLSDSFVRLRDVKYLHTFAAENVKNGKNTKASLVSGWLMHTYDRTASNAPDYKIKKQKTVRKSQSSKKNTKCPA